MTRRHSANWSTHRDPQNHPARIAQPPTPRRTTPVGPPREGPIHSENFSLRVQAALRAAVHAVERSTQVLADGRPLRTWRLSVAPVVVVLATAVVQRRLERLWLSRDVDGRWWGRRWGWDDLRVVKPCWVLGREHVPRARGKLVRRRLR